MGGTFLDPRIIATLRILIKNVKIAVQNRNFANFQNALVTLREVFLRIFVFCKLVLNASTYADYQFATEIRHLMKTRISKFSTKI